MLILAVSGLVRNVVDRLVAVQNQNKKSTSVIDSTRSVSNVIEILTGEY